MVSQVRPANRRVLPVFQSAETGECGLACLAMIGKYYGHDIDLNGLRQRFTLSSSGATLRHLMQIADEMSLTTRALRVDMGSLNRLTLPAILNWDMNHFVVLASVRGKRFVIHDPAHGKVEMSFARVSEHFTGVALEVNKAAVFEAMSANVPMRLWSLWSNLVGARRAISQILLLSVALQIATFVPAFQLQFVVDRISEGGNGNILLAVAVGFFLVALLQAFIEFARSWLLQIFGSQLAYQMVVNVVRHLLRLPPSYFEKRHLGDILSRLSGTKTIKDLLTQGLLAAVVDGGLIMISLAIMVSYSWVLSAIVLSSVLAAIIVNAMLYPRLRLLTEEQINAGSLEQTLLMETIRGISTIKMMSQEVQREALWKTFAVASYNSNFRISEVQNTLSLVQGILKNLQNVAVIVLGGYFVLTGKGLSLGMFMAFITIKQAFVERSISVLGQWSQFKLLKVYIERLGDIVGQEVEETGGGEVALSVKGNLQLSNVSFRYGVNDPWIFRQLSLSIGEGEFLAVTGPSGGGKTTLLKLMLGMQPPAEGNVWVEGLLGSPRIWRQWRSHIGVVSQDDTLLSGSLAENIAFFDPDISMDRVIEAAKAAQIHQDIVAKPMQYRTLVGDMGSALSGGQRQRILIARALYRRPKVLVLDEGTANLDAANEATIAEIIKGLPITRIVVAHRPALINLADRVMRVENGGIVDITHSWGDDLTTAGVVSTMAVAI